MNSVILFYILNLYLETILLYFSLCEIYTIALPVPRKITRNVIPHNFYLGTYGHSLIKNYEQAKNYRKAPTTYYYMGSFMVCWSKSVFTSSPSSVLIPKTRTFYQGSCSQKTFELQNWILLLTLSIPPV